MIDKRFHKMRTPAEQLKARYWQWGGYGLLILLTCIVQSTPRLIPELFGAKPLPVIPLTVCIAMFTGPVGGAAAGVAIGFLWDMYALDRLLGYHSLLLLVVGCAVGLLIQLLMRNNLLSAVLLTFGALLSVGLIDWLLLYLLLARQDAVPALIDPILINSLYTLFITPLVYGLTLLISRLVKRFTNTEHPS